MRSLIWIVFAALLSGSAFLYGQDAYHKMQLRISPSQVSGRNWKIENGLIITWEGGDIADRTGDQVVIFDRQGNPLTKLNVLATAKHADSLSIWDVCARSSSQIIAVAAVYRSNSPEVQTEDALLTYDFSGHLLGAFALPPWREILRLSLDDEGNIWTFTEHSGDLPPSQVPFVVEYDTSGHVVRTLLPRSMFPVHAKSIVELPATGGVGSGYESGTLWLWLPISTDLITITTADGKATVTKTGFPPDVVPLTVVRKDSGDIVAEVRTKSKPQKLYYLWSRSANAWSQVRPAGCERYRLVGARATQLVYMMPGTHDVCAAEAP